MKLFLIFCFLFSTVALGAGRLQNEDFKSLTDLTNAGGSVTQLLNDTKIYATGVTTPGQLSTVLGRLVVQVIPFAYAGAPATGDNQPWVQVPFAHTVTAVAAVCKTAGSSQSVIVIYKATKASVDSGTPVWNSILTTNITLDATKKTSAASATQPVLNGTYTSGAVGDYYKMQITTVGTSVTDITANLVFTMN